MNLSVLVLVLSSALATAFPGVLKEDNYGDKSKKSSVTKAIGENEFRNGKFGSKGGEVDRFFHLFGEDSNESFGKSLDEEDGVASHSYFHGPRVHPIVGGHPLHNGRVPFLHQVVALFRKVPHPVGHYSVPASPYVVHRPYPVYISRPYPVHIPKPVPYPVVKRVPYPVYVPNGFPQPVPRLLPIYVPLRVVEKVHFSGGQGREAAASEHEDGEERH